MTSCFFSSDLHGHKDRYQKLFQAIKNERPEAVFLGGDILPSAGFMSNLPDFNHVEFINDYLVTELTQLLKKLGDNFPRIFLILGNDDGRLAEALILAAAVSGVWEYVHDKKVVFKSYYVFGYSYIPPSPFLFKDWERYDVSRHLDPGCVSPEEGMHTFSDPCQLRKYSTIKKDLEQLTRNENLDNAIFLFHAPPYKTKLDRAGLDGKMIDHVPLDVHVGSIAIQRFIKIRQPLLTLHGHVHESSKLSYAWRDRISRTHLFSGAHDGPELALIRFDLENLKNATRDLI